MCRKCQQEQENWYLWKLCRHSFSQLTMINLTYSTFICSCMYRLIYTKKHLPNAKHGQPQPSESPASLNVKRHLCTKEQIREINMKNITNNSTLFCIVLDNMFTTSTLHWCHTKGYYKGMCWCGVHVNTWAPYRVEALACKKWGYACCQYINLSATVTPGQERF